jgi:hypothetical protein
MLELGNRKLVSGDTIKIKEPPEVADPSSNYYVWGSITFRRTVLGDTVDTAPPGFFLPLSF